MLKYVFINSKINLKTYNAHCTVGDATTRSALNTFQVKWVIFHNIVKKYAYFLNPSYCAGLGYYSGAARLD